MIKKLNVITLCIECIVMFGLAIYAFPVINAIAPDNVWPILALALLAALAWRIRAFGARVTGLR